MSSGKVLRWDEFVQQQQRQECTLQTASLALEAELKKLTDEQTVHAQALLRDLDAFDEACARIRDNSQVLEIVAEVQALCAEIDRLDRAEQILSLAIEIEAPKYVERAPDKTLHVLISALVVW